jgi:ATP-dependent exoDNAse (exonuclease V) beta subunit
MNPDGSPVERWPYRLMPESGPDGAVNPLPTGRSGVRVATIHRFKGLESPVVVLAELDSRVPAEQLPGLVYVGATRARSHLVVIGSDSVQLAAPA